MVEERKNVQVERSRVSLFEARKNLADAEAVVVPSGASAEEKANKVADAKGVLSLLESLEGAADFGPVLLCLLVKGADGRWLAALDASGKGDFTRSAFVPEYSLTQKFGSLDMLNYGIAVYEDGKVLSIITDCGAHGTHVAGISAAYFEGHPELNGVAPGAKIVSIKIGDSRLGSMETGMGLVRGMRFAVEKGCHIVNLSYGEDTRVENAGRVCDLAKELVHKKGVCKSMANTTKSSNIYIYS
jgi:tripeptidyl-peptidase II